MKNFVLLFGMVTLKKITNEANLHYTEDGFEYIFQPGDRGLIRSVQELQDP